jgi:hypothetical protein
VNLLERIIAGRRRLGIVLDDGRWRMLQRDPLTNPTLNRDPAPAAYQPLTSAASAARKAKPGTT